jgi:hypothetical protein
MRLVFAQSAGADPCYVDNIPAIRVEGEALNNASTGELIARHVAQEWKVGGKEYFRLDIEGPVSVRLEADGRRPASYGPYRHFSCADGIAYVDHQFFASLAHTTKMWHCIESEEDWPAFEVTPA